MKTKLLTAAVGVAAAISLAACGGGGSPSASTAAVDTSSQSYQMGLKTGTDGQAGIHAHGGFNVLTHQYEKVSPQEACEDEFNTDNIDLNLVNKDYMAGCLYGIAQHATVVPPSKKGPGGATVPNRPGS